MNDELIIIKQLPVIEEHLQRIKFEIEERVDAVLSLVCSESTYKDVKKARAELNARLTDFENRRKDVKKKSRTSSLAEYTPRMYRSRFGWGLRRLMKRSRRSKVKSRIGALRYLSDTLTNCAQNAALIFWNLKRFP